MCLCRASGLKPTRQEKNTACKPPSMAEQAPSMASRFDCGCSPDSRRRLDFGRPSQREAVCITRASLVVAFAFWLIILVATCQGDASAATVEVGLESLLDLVSTCIVLVRLQSPNPLAQTPRNNVIEARTSVLLALSMIALALVCERKRPPISPPRCSQQLSNAHASNAHASNAAVSPPPRVFACVSPPPSAPDARLPPCASLHVCDNLPPSVFGFASAKLASGSYDGLNRHSNPSSASLSIPHPPPIPLLEFSSSLPPPPREY